MSDLTYDDQRGRDQNPNLKKRKNNKEKSVDRLNAIENWVVRREIVVFEIKERLEIFKQKMKEVDNLEGQMVDLSQEMMVQH